MVAVTLWIFDLMGNGRTERTRWLVLPISVFDIFLMDEYFFGMMAVAGFASESYWGGGGLSQTETRRDCIVVIISHFPFRTPAARTRTMGLREGQRRTHQQLRYVSTPSTRQFSFRGEGVCAPVYLCVNGCLSIIRSKVYPCIYDRHVRHPRQANSRLSCGQSPNTDNATQKPFMLLYIALTLASLMEIDLLKAKIRRL